MKKTFQIWEHREEGEVFCHSMVRTDHTESLRLLETLEDEKPTLIHEFEASSCVEAMEKRNELLGFGPYIPMENMEGVVVDGLPYHKESTDD